MRILPLLALLVLAAAIAPLAEAHGFSPPPTEQDQILIQDRVDDCGPEAVVPGTPNANDCHGADALVGLVLQERWDGAEDQLVFRFYLDVGTKGPYTDTLTLTTPGGTKTLSVKSSDDKTFTAAGFDSVGAKQAVPGEGTRFLLDATISRAHLGVNVGDALTNFRVVSYSGSAKGDEMPGQCTNTLGPCNAPDTDEYVAGGGTGKYTVRGPSYYVTLGGPSGTQVATAGQDLGTPIMLDLGNRFHRLAQTVTLSVDGADGVTAGFHVGEASGATYKQPLQVSLDGDAGTILHLNLHGDRAGAAGTLTITATTSLGGRAQVQVPYEVHEASPVGGEPTATHGHDTTSKGSPAPSAALAALLLLLLGLALRRRT
ncbi:MAG TPA: hypothetical protein VM286_00360 [Candidatus Thermoplasmatota archaeon]|nr:hypothetical protein [Candidatus Thermoplasmatota archaeon]